MTTTRSMPALLSRSLRQQHSHLGHLMAKGVAALKGRLRRELHWLEQQRRAWARDMQESRLHQPRLLRAHVAAQAGRPYLLDAPLELISDDPRLLQEMRSFDSGRS
jgi:hypothetical protein